ncbi:MAG: carboxypeptidase regulatory-like domain-containing protein [Gemmatimonadaceae bacterium]|nr:carboxypeptidase regulatory-like domain-containing protein [Gemmatimonadaceae bacterium]MCW5825901.1 carboxypeptidase regulatory-like domain-containing protein [Gemmatimonadaceae bacterium]
MTISPATLRPAFRALAQASVLCAMLVGAPWAEARAQVIRGTVLTMDTELPIPSAEVTVRDSIGRPLGMATTNAVGYFVIRLRERSPFSVHARRLGFRSADTELLRVSADTVSLQFQMAEVALEADAVTVTGMAELNAARLAEAQRRGWRVYEPEMVAQHRNRARDFHELLRSIGAASLVMPRSHRDCVRSMRTNKCVTYVVDGQVLGPDAYILPSDVYFFAVLSPSQSQVMYGNRAMDGAVAVFTRQRGDRYDQSQLPPNMRQPERPAAGSATPAAAPATPPAPAPTRRP